MQSRSIFRSNKSNGMHDATFTRLLRNISFFSLVEPRLTFHEFGRSCSAFLQADKLTAESQASFADTDNPPDVKPDFDVLAPDREAIIVEARESLQELRSNQLK